MDVAKGFNIAEKLVYSVQSQLWRTFRPEEKLTEIWGDATFLLDVPSEKSIKYGSYATSPFYGFIKARKNIINGGWDIQHDDVTESYVPDEGPCLSRRSVIFRPDKMTYLSLEKAFDLVRAGNVLAHGFAGIDSVEERIPSPWIKGFDMVPVKFAPLKDGKSVMRGSECDIYENWHPLYWKKIVQDQPELLKDLGLKLDV